MAYDKEKVYKDLSKDYENAKSSKANIDTLISRWNDAYEGIDKQAPNKRLLVKEIAKIIEMQKPNITEPFLSTNNPAKLGHIRGLRYPDKVESWLNNTFSGDFNREDFIEDLVDTALREGTTWIRTGWNYKQRNIKERKTLSMEDILADDRNPVYIKELENGMFDVEYVKTLTIANHPTARVCRNENCFPDNTARTMEEMKFFIEKEYKTYYDIAEMGLFSKEQLSELKTKINNGNTNGFSSSSVLESVRDSASLEYGVDLNKTSSNLGRKKVKFISYWGFYDLNGDGKSIPIVAYWVEDFDHLIDVMDNPYPSGKIPYDKVNYSKRATSLWGKSVAFFLSENQNVKNGITKGILDNLALANNGQKFILRGALDFTEFTKLKNRNRYIMINRPDGITDGQYNSIPNSVFNMLQMVSNETDQMSGITAMSPALTQDNISKSNGSGLTMSQQKMSALVRNISGLLSRMFKEWLVMAEVFLDDEQIIELFATDSNGDEADTEEVMAEKFYDLNAFKDMNKASIIVTVGTDVAKMQKLQQLNMLMQQTKALGDNEVSPESIKALVAQMFDLFDMYEDATKLRTHKKQPNPMQEKMVELNMQMAQAKLEREYAEINKMNSAAMVAVNRAQLDGIKVNADSQYKFAQSEEKRARTEAHQVESSLRPGEAYMNMQEKLAKIARGDING